MRIKRRTCRTLGPLAVALLAVLTLAVPPGAAVAADWSATELKLTYGEMDRPFGADPSTSNVWTTTFQHASGWRFGDNFFFIDVINGDEPGYNDFDMYGELYCNLSLGKITGRDLSFGPVKDIGIIPLALNFGADANVFKYLPGIRVDWNVPGFAFFKTLFTAYIDRNEGVNKGGAPKQDDSYMIDFVWKYPFTIAGARFSVEGHAEYIGSREDELGNDVSWWVLAQPEFRFDLGNTLYGKPDQLFVGAKWQLWLNKLGDEDTDENTVLALLVWRL